MAYLIEDLIGFFKGLCKLFIEPLGIVFFLGIIGLAMVTPGVVIGVGYYLLTNDASGSMGIFAGLSIPSWFLFMGFVMYRLSKEDERECNKKTDKIESATAKSEPLLVVTSGEIKHYEE